MQLIRNCDDHAHLQPSRLRYRLRRLLVARWIQKKYSGTFNQGKYQNEHLHVCAAEAAARTEANHDHTQAAQAQRIRVRFQTHDPDHTHSQGQTGAVRGLK